MYMLHCVLQCSMQCVVLLFIGHFPKCQQVIQGYSIHMDCLCTVFILQSYCYAGICFSPPLWHDLLSDASWQGVELASPAGDPAAVSRARHGDEISFLSFHSGAETETAGGCCYSQCRVLPDTASQRVFHKHMHLRNCQVFIKFSLQCATFSFTRAHGPVQRDV